MEKIEKNKLLGEEDVKKLLIKFSVPQAVKAIVAPNVRAKIFENLFFIYSSFF